ncbi:hypothetical protein V4U94_004412 [Candida albicans]
MFSYQSFPIRDNSLFWSYGSILSKIGTALIDVLSLVPGASFGRCCSGFDQIAVTLLWISKLRIQNRLNGNSHFIIQCILLSTGTESNLPDSPGYTESQVIEVIATFSCNNYVAGIYNIWNFPSHNPKPQSMRIFCCTASIKKTPGQIKENIRRSFTN